MDGTQYALLAYAIGLTLILGYALLLWRAFFGIGKRERERESAPR